MRRDDEVDMKQNRSSCSAQQEGKEIPICYKAHPTTTTKNPSPRPPANMGRRRGGRKRSDSDVDESLEQRYVQKRQKLNEQIPNPQSPAATTTTTETKTSSDSPLTNEETTATSKDLAGPSNTSQEVKEEVPKQSKKQVSEKEERIEKLRLKKLRRKEQKQAKIQQKKKQDEEIQQQKLQLEQAKKKEKEQQLQVKQIKKNSSSSSFQSLRLGVQYQDIIVGKGPLVENRKKIHVSYKLRVGKDKYGKVLDSSKNFGFRLGRGEVIEGWDIGIQGMKQGGTRHLIIPPIAGYGQKNIGAGKGGMLFFEVSILSC